MKRISLYLLVFAFMAYAGAQSTISTIVYVTRTGTKYHLASCKSLKSSVIPMSLAEACQHYDPCSICSPPALDPMVSEPDTKIAESFAGTVVGITDGDTIRVLRDGKEVKIRLNGIDAPESSQAFGQRAKQICSELAFGKIVDVRVIGKDRYDRLVADIILPGSTSLNKELVALGMAWHYKAYSRDSTLASLESQAKSAKAGLWSDTNPVPPWDFRK